MDGTDEVAILRFSAPALKQANNHGWDVQALSRRTILLLGLTTGCALLVACDSGVAWQDERYIVRWIKDSGQMALDYKLNDTNLNYSLGGGDSVQRIPPVILSVGSNDFYVVAEQRPIEGGDAVFY